jgi:anti-sigma factor RsiW
MSRELVFSCAEVLELLPFGAALHAAEQAALEQHLGECGGCRREAQQWAQLAGLVRAAEFPVPAQHPGAKRQLLDRLDEAVSVADRPRGAAPTAPSRRWSWRSALAAGLVGVLVGLGAGFVGRPAATFQTLTAPGPPRTAAQLRVVFDPGATEVVIRELLLQLDAEVVAGPSAHGVWTLELGTARQAEAALAVLRASTAVRFAEQPLAPPQELAP